MLKELREKMGLSQKELAEISGVSKRMIEKYEINDRDISKAQAVTVYKLAQALGCKMEDLICAK